MRILYKSKRGKPRDTLFLSLGAVLFVLALGSGGILIWLLTTPGHPLYFFAFAGCGFTLSLVGLIRVMMNPDTVRARQTDDMLKVSRQIFVALNAGFDSKSSKQICRMLLPATTGQGIVITELGDVLGSAGFDRIGGGLGLDPAMCKEAAQLTLQDGAQHIVLSPRDMDLSRNPVKVSAAIIVPVRQNRNVMGTLQIYYRHPRQITETQISIAEGFGGLISTQLAATALEAQTKLAGEMQLKALQNQINPHFLFNTINTIASLIRTDPMKARNLLREFAVFYRQTLENSGDLIMLSRETEQTARYFMFEVARFGEDRVELIMEEIDDVEDRMVPAFIIQPLVENAVRHALPAEGKLTVRVTAEINESNELVIRVIDNGVGMTKEACDNIMHPESSTGCGIAVKNVHDRIKGFFGPDSQMLVESELGSGTTVTLILCDTGGEGKGQEPEAEE